MFQVITTLLLLSGWHVECKTTEGHVCQATYYEKGKAYQTLHCGEEEGCFCYDAQAITECGWINLKDPGAILKRAKECCK